MLLEHRGILSRSLDELLSPFKNRQYLTCIWQYLYIVNNLRELDPFWTLLSRWAAQREKTSAAPPSARRPKWAETARRCTRTASLRTRSVRYATPEEFMAGNLPLCMHVFFQFCNKDAKSFFLKTEHQNIQAAYEKRNRLCINYLADSYFEYHGFTCNNIYTFYIIYIMYCGLIAVQIVHKVPLTWVILPK